MARYDFVCDEHGVFEVSVPMAEISSTTVECPDCGEVARRRYDATPSVWHTDGSHNGDYGKGNSGRAGSKIDQLNRDWSNYYGESPPPPAKDVPKNSSEPF